MQERKKGYIFAEQKQKKNTVMKKNDIVIGDLMKIIANPEEAKKHKPSKVLPISDFCKALFIANGLSNEEVGKKLGKSRQNVNGIINNGRMNVGTFVEILKVCEQPFIILLKNGESFELEIKEKNNE